MLKLMKPTIKQIASKAKVSIATVSRVLNNDDKVTEETKKKVLQISNELNYKPNLIARNFAKKTSNAIGLILPEISDEFFTDIIRGVDEVTYTNGYYTMVASSHKNRTISDSISAFAQTGLVGGIILLISSMTEDLKNIINQTRIPVVIIGGGKESSEFDTVAIDNYQGAFEATEYLIKKKKFTRIAHITGPDENYDAYLRKKGFIDACKKNGITIDKSFIVNGNYTIDSGYHGFIQLYGLQEKPQAIFAANDMMALGCYDAANYFNIKIPNEISIIGFDDIFISKYVTPGLTTVRVQIDEVGKEAAKLLLERLNKPNGKAHSLIKIPTELVIRNSC